MALAQWRVSVYGHRSPGANSFTVTVALAQWRVSVYGSAQVADLLFESI